MRKEETGVMASPDRCGSGVPGGKPNKLCKGKIHFSPETSAHDHRPNPGNMLGEFGHVGVSSRHHVPQQRPASYLSVSP